MSTSKKQPDPTSETESPPGVKPATSGWVPLGEHRYQVDGDLLLLELSGSEILLADAEQLIEALTALQIQYGYYLLLADLRRGLGIAPAVRRRIANWSTDYRSTSATACLGAGTAARALVTLALQALRLLGRGTHRVEFFATREAGQRWLMGQRDDLARPAT